MATNFRVKMGEIGRLTFIRRLGIPINGVEYHNFDFKCLICDVLTTLCKDLRYSKLRSSNSGV